MPHDPAIATRLGPKGPRSGQATRLGPKGPHSGQGRSVRGEYGHLRLKDRIRPGVRVLFVGINPGVRSAETGHHFAGYSNRFWKLLYESGLVPEPISYRDDGRLPEWGFGITNLIASPSPGIDDLEPAEYLKGWSILERKIKKFKPGVVAFVGVTLYRSFCLRADATNGKKLCVGIQPQ